MARKATKEKESSQVVPSGYLAPEDIEWEFGGPIGAFGMMTGFPLLMIYMWLSAEFFGGKPAWPAEGQSWESFGKQLWNLFVTHGVPSFTSWALFTGFFVVQAIFY